MSSMPDDRSKPSTDYEGDDDPEALKRIFYKCPACGEEWEEEWTSACDSECPACGLGDITPVDWEVIE